MIYNDINKYVPYNEQEEKDKIAILNFLDSNDDAFLRSNSLCHMTASSWIVNKNKTKVLMCFHNIYNSWSWCGGHADGDIDLLEVALKESKEETGVNNIIPVSNEIYSIECLTVDGHIKKGNYVSSHLHYNVTYLLEADENETLKAKLGENSDVRWFSLDDALQASSEPWFVKHIYSKLNEKLIQYT